MTAAAPRLRALALALAAAQLAATLGCGGPDAFRADPPSPDDVVAHTPPTPEETRLDNGMRVLVVHRPELPLVAIQLGVARRAHEAKPGALALAARVRPRGAGTMSGVEVAQEAEAAGGEIAGWSNDQGTGLRAHGLSSELSRLFDLVGAAARSPRFDPETVELARAALSTEIGEAALEQEKLAEAAQRVALYPQGHPYAAAPWGSPASVAALNADDLRRAHEDTFGPDAVLVVAGAVPLALVKSEAQRVFGDWTTRQKKATPIPPLPSPLPPPPPVVFVQQPGATQATVRFAWMGAAAGSDDFDPLQIVASSLASRVSWKLREVHSATYVVKAELKARPVPSPLSISMQVHPVNVIPTVQATNDEVALLRRRGMGVGELPEQRDRWVAYLANGFETVRQTADTFLYLGLQGRPATWYADRGEALQNIHLEPVERAAETYLADERRTVIVVGDASLLPALRSLRLGPVVTYPAERLGFR